eukprot:GHVU01145112.1.p1 GENE.GHVU01145112.1~~GHVU01145112.1.p1  ORF type:complete len:201 (+),score=22.48 GHVU01145112.1:1361-1963(+)
MLSPRTSNEGNCRFVSVPPTPTGDLTPPPCSLGYPPASTPSVTTAAGTTAEASAATAEKNTPASTSPSHSSSSKPRSLASSYSSSSSASGVAISALLIAVTGLVRAPLPLLLLHSIVYGVRVAVAGNDTSQGNAKLPPGVYWERLGEENGIIWHKVAAMLAIMAIGGLSICLPVIARRAKGYNENFAFLMAFNAGSVRIS